jgi:protein TonB
VRLASSGWLVGEDHYGEVDKNWVKRLTRSMGASAAIELSVLLIIALVLAYKPVTQAIQNQIDPVKYVYLQQPGPGGGGGGSPAPAPPRPMSIPKHAEAPAPIVPPEIVKPVEPPKPELNAPIETTASTAIQATGFSSVSLAAYGGGGSGGGLGAGKGNGVGEGTGGGFGGGAYRPGNGVETPRLLKEVKPQYTAQAMRAKIQGEVLLECIVGPDGQVGNIRVVRSLDSSFGLDQEAIKAARQWRFAPGTRQGQPVAVLVTIAIAFTLR